MNPGPVRKISPPPRFDSRTVQPVASRYTGPQFCNSVYLDPLLAHASFINTVLAYELCLCQSVCKDLYHVMCFHHSVMVTRDRRQYYRQHFGPAVDLMTNR